MSIKNDSKTIVRNTVAIPTKLTAAALSGTAELSTLGVDALSLSVDAIKAVPTFAVGLGNCQSASNFDPFQRRILTP